uniref:Ribonuclease P n=1 Tax=Heterorhabditis bacteriophora TaxID=37862 RepID=A0A1I7X7E5_HETBA
MDGLMIWLMRRTNMQSQIKRIEDLLNNQSDQVYVHGLGASLNKALTLTVELQKKFSGAVQYHINTSTINVTDDLFPMSDEFELGVRNRPLSAVHVRLHRIRPK